MRRCAGPFRQDMPRLARLDREQCSNIADNKLLTGRSVCPPVEDRLDGYADNAKTGAAKARPPASSDLP